MADKFGYGVRFLTIVKMESETSTAAPVYGDQISVGSMNAVNFSRETANATAYGDDKKVADISVTNGGKLEATCWGIPLASSAALFGHTQETSNGELQEKMSDMAPYCGIGYIRTMVDSSNTVSYDAYWYAKAQAVQGDEEAETSGDDINLTSEKISFNVVEPQYGPFRCIQSFTTEEAAKTYIKTKAGISTAGA